MVNNFPGAPPLFTAANHSFTELHKWPYQNSLSFGRHSGVQATLMSNNRTTFIPKKGKKYVDSHFLLPRLVSTAIM